MSTLDVTILKYFIQSITIGGIDTGISQALIALSATIVVSILISQTKETDFLETLLGTSLLLGLIGFQSTLMSGIFGIILAVSLWFKHTTPE